MDGSWVTTFSHMDSGLPFIWGASVAVHKLFSLMWPCLFTPPLSPCPRRHSCQTKTCLRFYCLCFLLGFFCFFFTVLWVTFKAFIRFEFILVGGVSCWSSFILWQVPAQFPSTIYWRDCLYSVVFSCLHCQALIDHKSVGLSLGSHWSMCQFQCQCQAVLITVAL